MKSVMNKETAVKPLMSKALNSRGQVDLTEMQSVTYKNYKIILHYEDHLTKFSVLRPVKSKR